MADVPKPKLTPEQRADKKVRVYKIPYSIDDRTEGFVQVLKIVPDEKLPGVWHLRKGRRPNDPRGAFIFTYLYIVATGRLIETTTITQYDVDEEFRKRRNRQQSMSKKGMYPRK